MSANSNDVPTEASRVTEVCGDLFDAPEGSCLIHACNVKGSWGAGIAKVFKQKYPAAYLCYKEHCEEYQQDSAHHEILDLQSDEEETISVRLPLGTALVIPPQPEDYNSGKKKHWIICLFTSTGFGTRVDSPEQILNSTSAALEDLDMQLIGLREQTQDDGEDQPAPGPLFSCRFNSGLFAVPWEDTRELIEDLGLSMTVIYPEGE